MTAMARHPHLPAPPWKRVAATSTLDRIDKAMDSVDTALDRLAKKLADNPPEDPQP